MDHQQRLTPLQILIGPEEAGHISAIANGLAPRLDYRLVAEHSQASIQQWHPSPAGLRGPRWIRQGRSLLGNLGQAQRLARSLAAGSIVYSTGETWGLPVGVAGALARDRFFTHVVYVHRVFSPTWLRFLHASRGALAVDGWICVNQHQATLLRAALGGRSDRIAVISQGVDAQFYDPALVRAAPAEPYVLSVGAEMRNYPLLLAAAHQIATPVILKASSAWMSQPRQQPPPLPPNVTVLRQRLSYVELRQLYAGATLVVTPVHDTPQAAGITTILEGMAMGKAVVVTRSRGLLDGLASGHNCVIVEQDAAQLARAITTLLDDRLQRDAIAANGRCFVLEHYTLEHHVQQVAAFLQAVTHSR